MAAPAHGNGPNPDRTQECVAKIEAIAAKKESAHMTYMADCSRFAEETKEVYDEAKTAWGLPKRALKTVVKERELTRKIEALREDLEPNDQDSYDQIKNALGMLADLPLGQSALGEDFQQDVRGTDQKDKEAFRNEQTTLRRKKSDDALNAAATGEGQSNAEKLTTGIKPLH